MLTLYLITILFIGCTTIPKYMSKEDYKELKDGLYAHMETSKGDMLIQFYDQQAPMTVANFIGLAEGVKPNEAKKKGIPYYDGLIFHRVIKDFMIQGGDPKGTGVGGPGYDFEDEVDNDLKHNEKGILSMANAGPNTNGSQFFITEVPTPWLDGKHTIFGKVIKGLEVIDTIANVKKDNQDKPLETIKINKVEILRKGESYKKYDANKAFEKAKEEHRAKMEEKERKEQEAMQKEIQRIKDLSAKAQKTDSGLGYVIVEEGIGEKPQKGDNIDVHYTLRLANGKKLDSSYDRNQPLNIDVGLTQLIEGWMEALTLFNRGSKVFLIIPPSLGYGAQGAGGVVPPNATLYFDMEVLK